ncbi:MAG: hypothetical protein H6828_10730 [Planctomycetes bacterium]|nr:hypothetical protein [Planctomycetota bacterium]
MGLLGGERSRANWLGSVSLCKKEYHMKMAYPGEARLRLVTVLQAAVAEPGPSIRAPASAAEQARELLGDKDREQFMVFHLDGKHRLVSAETISVGALMTSLVQTHAESPPLDRQDTRRQPEPRRPARQRPASGRMRSSVRVRVRSSPRLGLAGRLDGEARECELAR